MAMTAADVLKMIKDNEVKFVDFRFTDTRGKEQHVPFRSAVHMDKFEGHAFDGSSIAGWKGIEASDMLLMPDPDTANIDPFMDETTLVMTCDVIEPSDGKGYDRDPRSIAKRAEAYLKVHRPGRHRLLRPGTRILHFRLRELEGGHVRLLRARSTPKRRLVDRREIRRRQHRPPPPVKGGYFPVPPVDSLQDIRSAMCLALEEHGHRGRSASPRSGRAPARTKSAPSSARWSSAPTGRRT